jgi:hypothetical protein
MTRIKADKNWELLIEITKRSRILFDIHYLTTIFQKDKEDAHQRH